MFVYNCRHSDIDVPSSWVIITRSAALLVTAVIAWPLLDIIPALRVSLVVYAIATLVVLLIQIFAARSSPRFLNSFVRGAQFACELAVISQIVLHTGGMRSPSIFLYLMTIISAAVSYRLVGTLLVSSAAAAAYVLAIWLEAGHGTIPLRPTEWLGTVNQLPDEDFFIVFAHLCIFFLCAFTGGFLAQRLWSKDRVLANATKALEVAKLETGDILKHLQSGILTVDLAGRIVYFNRAAETILGIPGRSVRGHSLRDVLGRQYPALVDRLEAVLMSRKMDLRTELTLQRSDGRTIPIGISTSVLGSSANRPRGVISIFQDLTEPKLIEEKMRAQDRLAAIGQLAAAIAHEIRNPLASISGSVEVLRDELKVEGENQNLLNLIIKESGRLNKILSDFLMYARIRPTVSGRVCVATVLSDVFEIARRRFDGLTGIVLRVDIADPSLAVQADTDHTKQILINLVFNAVEALEKGAGEVLVTVKLLDESVARKVPSLQGSLSDWVEVDVKDDGVGIPDTLKPRLFEPFVSSKPSGTGLGLAIVSRLVEHAGGHVLVDNCAGMGTTFTVILPRCRGTQSPVPSVATERDDSSRKSQ